MNVNAISLQPFGALKEGSLYIERAADRDLHEAILSGQYCFVSAPRQYGKSSLCAHACRSLQRKGVLAVTLELTQITRATEQLFFEELIKELADRLGWPAAKRREFLGRRPSGSDESLWRTFLRQVVQESKHEVALFFDEVESLTEPGSDVEEFFLGLRDLAIRREVEPSFRKLAVCLVGQFPHKPDGTPDLLQNFVATCRRIQLEPFTALDLRAFRPALEALGDSNAIVTEVFNWTSGHPYLTHRLCHALRDSDPMMPHTESAQVAKVVERVFLQPARPDDDYLRSTRLRLQQLNQTPVGAQRVSDMLRLYRRVLEKETIPGNPNSRLQEELVLLGLCRIEGGRLVPLNRVSERFFDTRWTLQSIPRTWFSDALHKWRASNVDERARSKDLLLSGWQLAEAERWLYEWPENLDAAERNYIRLSQQSAQRTRTVSRFVPYVMAIAFVFTILSIYFFGHYYLKSQEMRIKLGIAQRQLTEIENRDKIKQETIENLRKESRDKDAKIETLSNYKEKYDELILVYELDRMSLQDQANEIAALQVQTKQYAGLLSKLKEQINEKDKLLTELREERRALQRQRDELRKKQDKSRLEMFSALKSTELNLKISINTPIEVRHNDSVIAISLSETGKHIITATVDGFVHFWNLKDSTKTSQKIHQKKVEAIATHQGINRAASAGADGNIVLFELSTGKALRTIIAHPGGAIALAFSPDGRWLLSGGEDKNARVWNAISGDSVATFSGHNGAVSAVAFSGNSQYAITGSSDKTARIWECTDNTWKTQSLHILGEHKNWVSFVWLNEEGNRALVSTAAGRSDLWSIDIKPLYRVSLGLLRDKFSKFLKNDEAREAKGPVLALLPFNGQTYFASSDSRNIVWVWKATSGEPVQRLEVLNEKKDQNSTNNNAIQMAVNAVTFSKDGKYIATASDDGVVRIWRLKLDGTP